MAGSASESVPNVLAIRKSDSADVRVSRTYWKGREVIDIRVWYLPDNGKEFVPSRKGLTIDANKLPELLDLLKKVA